MKTLPLLQLQHGSLLAIAIAAVAAFIPREAPGPGDAVITRPKVRATPAVVEPFKKARIYWEYNATDHDLGVHVSLDADNWKRLRIAHPGGQTLFDVKGMGPYQSLGMTELFFEGAEPSLNEVPLQTLLGMFPEGEYEFEGRTVDGEELESSVPFSHAIPAGPSTSATLTGSSLVIGWSEVTAPPAGFPIRPIQIVGYQVIVGSFQVTLPSTAQSVTVPPEFVSSLPAGEHDYEVLAVDISGNQTLTASTFVK